MHVNVAVIVVPHPTYIYHITHLNNLGSIVANGGLRSNTYLRQTGTGFTDIAYQSVQDKRATTYVPCGPGGCLHDYVPFYFAPRSPMLCTIHHRNVPGYSDGQQNIIHLVSTVQKVVESALPFVFTDGHGIVAITDFYDDLSELKEVDWAVMRMKMWTDTTADPDRKRRRQAEFLVHHFVGWPTIVGIGVMTSAVRSQVEACIERSKHKPVVRAKPEWYY